MAHAAIVRAALKIGRTFGVGGSSWRYFEPEGDSVTAEPRIYARGLRSLYIVRERPTARSQAQPGAPVGVDRFVLVAALGTDVATGGIVQSAADDTLVFSLGTLEDDQGFLTGIVEKAQLPDTITYPALARQGLRAGLRIGMA